MLWPKASVMQMFWLECQMSLLERNTQIFTVWNTEIYYSKVAKNKQKPTFCRSWFNCCGNWLHLGFSWKIPCNFFFFNIFSIWKACIWQRTRVPLFFGREDRRCQVGCSVFINGTLVNSTMIWHTILCSLKLLHGKSLLSGRPGFQKEWLPPK